MRRILLTIPVVLLLGSLNAPSSSAVEFNDPYLPIIKSLKVDYKISVNKASSGKKSYSLYADIALAVRVHANSLAGFTISVRPATATKSSPGCQNVIPSVIGSDAFRLDVGNTTGLTSGKSIPVLKNFVGSKKDGDWLLQGYEFQLLLRDDFLLPPCVTDFKTNYLYLIDEALHEKSIFFGYGSSPIYEMFTQPSNLAARKLLPENSCPVGDAKEFAGSLVACAEDSSISAIQVGYTQSKIDGALKLAGAPPVNASSGTQQMKARVSEIDERITFLDGSIKSANATILIYSERIAEFKKYLAAAKDDLTRAKWATPIDDLTSLINKLRSAVANATTEIADLKAERQKLLASIASASSTPTPSPKPSSTVKKFGSIQCQKGKEIKKFMGYNPVCPKGFTLLK
jgi:uncharacterized small protein (DUF1192 family)